jgi:predicted permease
MTDFKVAFRLLAKSPGFTVIAIVTLALGIGFSASSFSMANAFLLRNVPYPESRQLVRIFRTSPQSLRLGHSPANLLDIRSAVTSFTGIAIYNLDTFALGESGQPAEQVTGLKVTADFFDVLRVHPMLGRGFAVGDDAMDKPKLVVIGYRTWMRRYGSNPAIIGQTIRLDSEPYTVIGVLPPGFDAPLVWGPADFITARTLQPEFQTQRSNPWMQCVARLKPGVGMREAQAELDTIAARLRQQYPTENGQDGLRALDLYVSNMDDVSKVMLWLMTIISLAMLLIACANLASLQIARALARAREFAIRSALGGDRARLMLPLLTESVLLGLVGGVLGLLVASWSNDIIGSLLLINDERGINIPLDGRVLVFDAVVSLLSGIAFGFAPAWLAARSPAADALKEGARGATAGVMHHRIKRTLIITELALAIALVGVAGSFGIGATTFVHRPVGWNINGLFAGYLVLPYNRYTDEQCRTFERDALERMRTIPGVDHAAITTGLPVYGLGRLSRIVVEGQPVPDRGREPTADTCFASPDYFATLQIPLRQGAFFNPTIKAGDRPVGIVNAAFADRFWPGQSAIGRRVRLAESNEWIEIVGVSGNTRMAARPETPETALHLYRPLAQNPSHYLAIVVRGNVAPETLATPVRQAIAAIDPDLPVARAGSLRAELERNMSNIDLVVVNLATSAGMGLLIAAVGLFGVISQLTIQRTRDIGVRIALGAQASHILKMIVSEGMGFLVIGTLVGVPLFYAMNTVIQRAIPEAVYPGVWLLATDLTVLGATMLLACWLPARRATLINPVDALRAE